MTSVTLMGIALSAAHEGHPVLARPAVQNLSAASAVPDVPMVRGERVFATAIPLSRSKKVLEVPTMISDGNRDVIRTVPIAYVAMMLGARHTATEDYPDFDPLKVFAESDTEVDADRLQAQHGTITRAPGLKVAFFAQHQIDDLRPEETAVQHVRRAMPDAPEAKVRAKVARMGLATEKMDTVADKLSGGEKARLLMGLATLDAPNLLILDEPTAALNDDDSEHLLGLIRDEELGAASVEELGRIGLRVNPHNHLVHRFTAAMPQPGPLHHERIDAVRTGLSRLPGLFAAGAGVNGAGVPNAIIAGHQVATDVLEEKLHD